MTDDSRSLAVEGVRFFGEMSASVSHEIKNVLAIINENAGLLQDMVVMNQKGMSLAPERLAGLAQSISRQVARGDRIVKSMNQFAHSADYATETVDVHDVIGFVVNLASRLIAMKGEGPRIQAPAAPVTAETNRFFLENLVWNCLCRAMAVSTPEQAVSISTEIIEKTVRIRFHGLKMNEHAGTDADHTSREMVVCRMLNAEITTDEKKGEIVLVLL